MHPWRIVRAYRSPVIRLYCVLRFRILRRRFLEEIGQYLPENGVAFEIGCGFGLFSIYFATMRRGLRLTGVDLDRRRIADAVAASRRLGLDNVEFRVGDARELRLPEDVDAFYMLDIVHHIPREVSLDLFRQAHERLTDEGVLLIKDVGTRPRYKMAFTWILDVLMTGGERPQYWSTEDLAAELRKAGFDVVGHRLVDVLPYPHHLYVCSKRPTSTGAIRSR